MLGKRVRELDVRRKNLEERMRVDRVGADAKAEREAERGSQ
jgi:hypothetical protein